MAVQIDFIEGAELSEDENGYKATRIALVTGLQPTTHKALFIALTQTGLPKFGDPHPSIPGISCVSRACKYEGGNDKVRVTLEYAVPQPSQTPTPPPSPGQTGSQSTIRVGGSTQRTTTQKDAFGANIVVSHKFPANFPDAEFAGKDVPQGADAEIEIPNVVLSETRKEFGSPSNLAKSFVGTVNASSIWGGAPRTFLCTRIEGVTNDLGLTFEVTYEFQFNPQTWDATIVFRDPRTQKPLDQPVEGQSIKTFQVYRQSNFFALGLNL